MAVNSRRKGAQGERELARLLQEHLGVEFRRNLEQSRDGGYDLNGLPALALECKRHRTDSDKRAWWAQATEQALRSSRIPVLAYRVDRREWRFLLRLADVCGDPSLDQPVVPLEQTVEMGIEPFAMLCRERWIAA